MSEYPNQQQLDRHLGQVGTSLLAIRDLAALVIDEGHDPHHLNWALIALAQSAGRHLDACQRILELSVVGGGDGA